MTDNIFSSIKEALPVAGGLGCAINSDDYLFTCNIR